MLCLFSSLVCTSKGLVAKQDHKVMMVRLRKVNETIVNGWLFFRYLVIGAYVGLDTIVGFA